MLKGTDTKTHLSPISINTNILSNGEDHAYCYKEEKSLPDFSEAQQLKINALTRQKEDSNQKK